MFTSFLIRQVLFRAFFMRGPGIVSSGFTFKRRGSERCSATKKTRFLNLYQRLKSVCSRCFPVFCSFLFHLMLVHVVVTWLTAMCWLGCCPHTYCHCLSLRGTGDESIRGCAPQYRSIPGLFWPRDRIFRPR